MTHHEASGLGTLSVQGGHDMQVTAVRHGPPWPFLFFCSVPKSLRSFPSGLVCPNY